MTKSVTFLVVSFVSISALIVGCGPSSFTGNTPNERHKLSSDAMGAADSFVAIGVDYQDDTGVNLNLVSNALAGFKGDLIGGEACWGPQATSFSATPAGKIKIRKGATGCSIVMKELSFQESALVVVKNANGLSSDSAESKDFVDANGSTDMLVKVKQNFSSAVDSTLILSGKIAEVVTVPVDTTNQEISISLQGDVVAYPNVKISAGPFLFLGTIDVTLACLTKHATVASACLPSVLPQAGGDAGAQLFGSMDAAIVVLKGDAATTFPRSMTTVNLDSLFASGKIDGVAQGVSNKPAGIVGADSVQFKAMTLSAIGAGDKPALVVRYFEMVSGAKVFTYKVFLLKI